MVCQETTTAQESGAVEETVDLDTEEDAGEEEPVQSGPLIDLLGPKLESLKMVDQQSAQVMEHYTNEALAGKSVIGLYFSADWYVVVVRFSFRQLVSSFVHQRMSPRDNLRFT